MAYPVPVRRLRAALVLAMTIVAATPSLAIDPLYEPQMERLSEIMGSLYFLSPLCAPGGTDWRVQMSELIATDNPDDDRRQRLTGAFNTGYQDYGRVYRECTPSAREAMTRLLVEAEKTARDIHAHFAQ